MKLIAHHAHRVVRDLSAVTEPPIRRVCYAPRTSVCSQSPYQCVLSSPLRLKIGTPLQGIVDAINMPRCLQSQQPPLVQLSANHARAVRTAHLPAMTRPRFLFLGISADPALRAVCPPKGPPARFVSAEHSPRRHACNCACACMHLTLYLHAVNLATLLAIDAAVQ